MYSRLVKSLWGFNYRCRSKLFNVHNVIVHLKLGVILSVQNLTRLCVSLLCPAKSSNLHVVSNDSGLFIWLYRPLVCGQANHILASTCQIFSHWSDHLKRVEIIVYLSFYDQLSITIKSVKYSKIQQQNHHVHRPEAQRVKKLHSYVLCVIAIC